jgi:hypothetical protein
MELVVAGVALGVVTGLGLLLDRLVNGETRRTKRTIRDIHQTRDEALSRMQSAHQQFIDRVNRQTRGYRR